MTKGRNKEMYFCVTDLQLEVFDSAVSRSGQFQVLSHSLNVGNKKLEQLYLEQTDS